MFGNCVGTPFTNFDTSNLCIFEVLESLGILKVVKVSTDRIARAPFLKQSGFGKC